jgi:hypothetical protein
MADQTMAKAESPQSEGTPLLATAQGGPDLDNGRRTIEKADRRPMLIGAAIGILLLAVVSGTAYHYTKRYNTSSAKVDLLDADTTSSTSSVAEFSYLAKLPNTPLDSFPTDFVWGVATSAYQIEGATAEDGRGPSVWDVFVRQPGVVLDGATGDVADDHYHLWRNDVDLLDELGVTAYRFSISWSRILPTGRGEINPKGLQFYDRLIDALLERNIEPWITLFHWDLPQGLQDDFGGWMDTRTIDAFEEYSRVIFHHFAHKVKHFITLNEPWT